MRLRDFIAHPPEALVPAGTEALPWEVLHILPDAISRIAGSADPDAFVVAGGIVQHRSARIEPGAVVKPPVFVGPECFVASGAYLRGGVFLERAVTVGPACEVARSVVMAGSRIAHLAFVGDTVVGADVNLEAGVVVANRWNESPGREVVVVTAAGPVATGLPKFGAVIGDGCRVGANAVLSPGTALPPGAVVARLALVDQSQDVAADTGGRAPAGVMRPPGARRRP